MSDANMNQTCKANCGCGWKHADGTPEAVSESAAAHVQQTGHTVSMSGEFRPVPKK